VSVTDENGLFDARGHDLTLIVMIDRRVGLSLSRGEPHGGASRRVWRRIPFCGDEKLGCMVEGDYTAAPSVLSDISPKYDNENFVCGVENWCLGFGGEQVTEVTDENGLFDAWGYDLTLIETIDRRVGLTLPG